MQSSELAYALVVGAELLNPRAQRRCELIVTADLGKDALLSHQQPLCTRSPRQSIRGRASTAASASRLCKIFSLENRV